MGRKGREVKGHMGWSKRVDQPMGLAWERLSPRIRTSPLALTKPSQIGGGKVKWVVAKS